MKRWTIIELDEPREDDSLAFWVGLRNLAALCAIIGAILCAVILALNWRAI